MQANNFSDEYSRWSAAPANPELSASPRRDNDQTDDDAEEDPVLDEEDLEENDLDEDEADDIEWEDEEENPKGGENTGE